MEILYLKFRIVFVWFVFCKNWKNSHYETKNSLGIKRCIMKVKLSEDIFKHLFQYWPVNDRYVTHFCIMLKIIGIKLPKFDERKNIYKMSKKSPKENIFIWNPMVKKKLYKTTYVQKDIFVGLTFSVSSPPAKTRLLYSTPAY